jgi:hypothetical protein
MIHTVGMEYSTEDYSFVIKQAKTKIHLINANEFVYTINKMIKHGK